MYVGVQQSGQDTRSFVVTPTPLSNEQQRSMSVSELCSHNCD